MLLETSTPVDAPPDAVWAVLADVERWPETSDSFESVRITSGDAFGEGSTARVKQPGMPELTWTVTRWQPGIGFDWQTRVAGTVTVGIHRIEPDGTGARLILEVHQRGALAPLLALLSGRRTRRYVQLELEGTKAAAERRAARG